MGTLPRTKNEQIAFFEQRLPLWNANAAALGLTLPQLTDLATQTTTAHTDYDAAQIAHAASLAPPLAPCAMHIEQRSVASNFNFEYDHERVFDCSETPASE